MSTDQVQGPAIERPKNAGVWLVWVAVAGIVAMIVLSLIFGARFGTVLLGLELIALAFIRRLTGWAGRLAARSRTFDVAFLGSLGTAIVIVALTADNI